MNDLLEKWLFDPIIGRVIAVFVAVIVVVIVVRLIHKSLSRFIKVPDTRYHARKFVSFFGYALAIFIIAIIFSNKLGGLTVAFGVAGAGIAFALQEVIASVAGWAALALGSFYKTGDRVQLGGIKGDVIDIGILRTTVMECGQWVNGDLYNGRVVRIANSFVFKEPVFNYSGDFPFLWDEITIPIKHGCDHNLAGETFERLANEVAGDYAQKAQKVWTKFTDKYMAEEARVAPMVTLAMDENWMTFTIRYVVDYKKRRITKDHFYRRILDELAKAEGRITLAYATLAITETPRLNVNLNSNQQN